MQYSSTQGGMAPKSFSKIVIGSLALDGKLVIPVGMSYLTQHLQLVCKDARREIDIRNLLTVAFVPLVEG